MKKDGCIFCMLANGDIPTNTIYEDEEFRVIMDNAPATKGHALVLPKNHYANIYEMPEELLSKAIGLAKVWGEKIAEALGADGLNLVQNNGLAAGQTVFHFHLHLIPRYDGDAVGDLWTPGSITDEDRKTILDKLA